MKEKLKTQTHYAITLKIKGEYEGVDIIQEENVPHREAIKVMLYQERWRAPEDMIELFKKVIIVIEQNFLK